MTTDADAKAVAGVQGRIADIVMADQGSVYGEAARDSVAMQLVLERMLAAVRRELDRAARDIARGIGPIGSDERVRAQLAGLITYGARPRVRTTPLPAGVATPALGHETVVAREAYATDQQPTRSLKPNHTVGPWDVGKKGRKP